MVNLAKIRNTLHQLKPAILMVIVQTAFAGVTVFYKLVANDGMNLRILIAYRFLFAAAFISPIALYVERNKRPKLTWMVLVQSSLCGLFGGAMSQNFYAAALNLTSATFVSAMSNLIPAITFVMAICLRMEKLGWRTTSGTAKVVGTLVGIVGAMLLTLYRGKEIHVWRSHIDLLKNGQRHVARAGAHHESSNMVLGSLLVIASCFCYALWLIIQAKMAEKYPCPYSSTALMAIMGSVQGTVFAVATQKEWSDWRLGWDIRLLLVAFMGIVASGVMFTVMAWCVRMRGPLFVSAFNPLLLILVAIAGCLFLDESLHLGSVLGAVLIICGLYSVLWGKSKEAKRVSQLMQIKDSGEEEDIEIIVTSSTKNKDVTIGNRNSVLPTAEDEVQESK